MKFDRLTFILGLFLGMYSLVPTRKCRKLQLYLDRAKNDVTGNKVRLFLSNQSFSPASLQGSPRR